MFDQAYHHCNELLALFEKTGDGFSRIDATSYHDNFIVLLFFIKNSIENKSMQGNRAIGNTLHQMAYVYRHRRNYEQATTSATDSLRHRMKYLGRSPLECILMYIHTFYAIIDNKTTPIPGKEHPDVAQSLNFLACLRLEQNIIDSETESMYLDALHIAEVTKHFDFITFRLSNSIYYYYYQ